MSCHISMPRSTCALPCLCLAAWIRPLSISGSSTGHQMAMQGRETEHCHSTISNRGQHLRLDGLSVGVVVAQQRQVEQPPVVPALGPSRGGVRRRAQVRQHLLDHLLVQLLQICNTKFKPSATSEIQKHLLDHLVQLLRARGVCDNQFTCNEGLLIPQSAKDNCVGGPLPMPLEAMHDRAFDVGAHVAAVPFGLPAHAVVFHHEDVASFSLSGLAGRRPVQGWALTAADGAPSEHSLHN